MYKNTVYPGRRNESFGCVFLYAFFMEAVQQFSGAATPRLPGVAMLSSILLSEDPLSPPWRRYGLAVLALDHSEDLPGEDLCFLLRRGGGSVPPGAAGGFDLAAIAFFVGVRLRDAGVVGMVLDRHGAPPTAP